MKALRRILFTVLAAIAVVALTLDAAAQTATNAGPAARTPGQAAALSIVPGLCQHQLGEHGKALLMESAVVGGIVLVAANGDKSGSGDGGGSYTPPPAASGAIPARFAIGGTVDPYADGGGGNNDDEKGSSGARVIGYSLIVGGVAWSMIDAFRSASADHATAGSMEDDASAPHSRLAMHVVPTFTGVRAGLAMKF